MGWSDAWHAFQGGAQAVGNFVHDVGTDFTGGETVAEQQQDQRAKQATQQGNAQRAQLEAQARGVHVGGYDPPFIQQHDNWEHYSHGEIHSRNQKLLPPGNLSQQAIADWNKLGGQITDLGQSYVDGLSKLIQQGGWSGQAADAAMKSTQPLSDWMKNSSGAFQGTGLQLETAVSAAQQVKTAVGPPPTQNIAQMVGQGIAAGAIPVAGVGVGGVDAVHQMQQQQQEQKAAQETMARVLGQTYQQADAQVPTYQNVNGTPAPPPSPAPPQSGPLPPPVAPGSGGGHAGSGGAGGGFAGSGGNLAGGSSGSVSGGNLGSGVGSGTPAGTASASAAAPTMQPSLGASGVGSGGAAGAGGTAGGFGGAVGGFGGAAGGLGGVAGGRAGMSPGGRAGLGGSGSSGSGRAGAAGSGAAGRSGGAGSGAMGGAGQGRRGEGDDEHERPSWLEEFDDIWLNDMPPTAPPVIGE